MYVPDELKHRIEALASSEGRSEASVIRDALNRYATEHAPPRPKPSVGLYRGDGSSIADRIDEYMHGFGEN